MRKKLSLPKKCLGLLLLGVMVICNRAPAAYAAENGPGELYEVAETEEPEQEEGQGDESAQEIRKIEIYNKDAFLWLAENCRIDSFSRNVKVVLKADIDLSDADFEGIPIFAGEFDGNGHCITGLSIDGEGSVRGLFRYLQDTAVVQNLVVEGEVIPAGTRSDVGGIAGNNAGIIRNCEFHGIVSGADNVGGIAGINEVSGIIEKCRAEGTVSGNHFLGGIVGQNSGVVRRSVNSSLINTTVEQNSVGLSDITIESLAGSESVAAVTDIGGIAGSSSGVLKNCTNYGQVGYRQMGYNVGGIVGSQVGYVVDCLNYGDVYGRKEVGGIVGHQEPNVTLIYEVDTFQTLGEQLDTMEKLTNRTTSNAQSGVNKLNSQMNTMNGYVKDAQDSVDKLNQMYQEGDVDPDSMIAYQNHLGESLKGMASTMQSMTNTTKSTVNTLNRNVQAINNQMNAINDTLDSAEEGLGGDVTDVSDADTEELMSSEIFSCDNYGMVEGELNVGGIVGIIALETDLDTEDDVDILGEASANFISEMRSVVLDSKNWGIIYVKKQYGGGIVGRQDLGLVKGCTNVGTVDGEAADYVGGIAGQSLSYIRACNVKCVLKGQNNVGGIAGSGTIASDCRSMTEIQGGVEMLGAIFGLAQDDIKDEKSPIVGNYYVPVGADMGAIDGISYAAYAEPMEREVFLQLENLSDVFKVVTVQFLCEDTTVKSVTLQIGQGLQAEQIPEVPQKCGKVGAWEGLDVQDLSEIAFDMQFEAVYLSNFATLQSDETGEIGKPILLVLGEFAPDQKLALTELTGIPICQDEQKIIAAWEYALDGDGKITEVRYLIPTAYKDTAMGLWICDSLGVWREGTYEVDGSYLVFSVNADDEAFALLEESSDGYFEIWILAGACIVLFGAIVLGGRRIIKKRRSKKEKSEKSEAET